MLHFGSTVSTTDTRASETTCGCGIVPLMASDSYIDVYHRMLEDADMPSGGAGRGYGCDASRGSWSGHLAACGLIPRARFDAALRAPTEIYSCLMTVERAVVDDDVRAAPMLDASIRSSSTGPRTARSPD
jgi:hypothetical protein